MIIDFSPIF